MSEDDDEYKYEYVNNTSNCKYAIYTLDANPDKIAFNGKFSYIQNLMDFLQILVSCLKY